MRALIVEDGLSRQALAAARALAADGWDLGIASPEPTSVAAASRSARQWHRVAAPSTGIERFAGDVENAIRSGGYEVVFGARDVDVAALASVAARLPAKVAHPNHEIVLTAQDKLELARLGQAAGFAVPETFAPDEAGAAEAADWIVKPRSPGRSSARPARGETELRAAVSAVAAAGDEPVVQERLRGGLIAVVVLADGKGSIVRAYQQVAELAWPLDAGISVRARVVAADPGLLERSAELVRALGWSGIAQIQLLEPAGEEPRLIDFNGRFFGSIALAAAAGSNIAAAWARGVFTGETPDPGAALIGTRYQWAWGDLRRATQERRGGLLRDVASVVRYAPGAAHSVFDLRDPRPAARYLRVAGSQARRRRASAAGKAR